jgi:dipeptidyl aminopeptidase/acylaminoacyl peptidase
VFRKSIVITAAAIVGCFLCFTLIGAIFCGATLHVPRRLGRAPLNAKTVAIIAADKANLSAWWIQPSKSNGSCVVVLHGIADSRVSAVGFAPMFLNQGYAVLLPDSRAHGASEGRFVTYGLLEKYDVITWTNWMMRAGCRNVYGLGESLGASILIQAAAVQPAFAAIVAECPYADLRETAEYRVRQMLRTPAFIAVPAAKMAVSSGMLYANWAHGLDFQQVSPIRSIARASSPILLIHGLNDFRTPSSNSEKLASANPRDPLWLVPNALHTGAAEAAPEEFRRRVLGWFTEH